MANNITVMRSPTCFRVENGDFCGWEGMENDLGGGAEFMNEPELAAQYYKTYISGSKKLDEISFNGEYYEQIIDDVDNYRYQYGKGCLSDQLLGQFLAYCAGLDNSAQRAYKKGGRIHI